MDGRLLAVVVVLVVCGTAHGFINPKWAANPDGSRFKSAKFSFKPPFQFIAGSAVPHWEYGGSTLVMDEFVRLTPDRQSQAGWLYNVDQCYIHNWRAEMKFRMHGSGTRVFGDGMAFWYRADSPRQVTSGPVFGMPDLFQGLGVFVDTFDNNADKNNPVIGVMIGDGATAYDSMDGTQTQAGQCTADVHGTPGPVVLLVTYNEGKLSVLYKLEDASEWRPCVELEQVDLPLGYHFGVSAATGDVADNHDVYSFSVTNMGGLNDLQNGAEPNRRPSVLGSGINLSPEGETGRATVRRNNYEARQKKPSSGWGWVIALIIVLLLIGGAIGYAVYALSKDDKKRF